MRVREPALPYLTTSSSFREAKHTTIHEARSISHTHATVINIPSSCQVGYPSSSDVARHDMSNSQPHAQQAQSSNGHGRPRYHQRHYRNHNNYRNQQPRSYPTVIDEGDPESQRKRLEEQLRNQSYECMVCCEEVTRRTQVCSSGIGSYA